MSDDPRPKSSWTWRIALALLVGTIGVALVALTLAQASPTARVVRLVLVLLVLTGSAVSYIVRRGLTFEWMVATRYLRLRETRSARLHGITLVLTALLVLVFAASWYLDHGRTLKLQELRDDWGKLLATLQLVLLVLTVLIEVFLRFARPFSIFSAISGYGLFLGTGALVIVLSVMSGFENDLRRKILGTHAHIVVTPSPDHAFTDYEDVRKKLAALHGVVGVSPFISNEVMMSSSSNLSGVILKGIDPATVGQVTDLARNVDIGDLSYLNDPEKLRELGGPPILRHDDDDLGPSPSPAPGAIHFKLKDAPEPPRNAEPRKVVPGVVVGRELAKNLRLYLGDDVNIVSPSGGIGPMGAIPKSKPFRVAGIFYSEMFEYDSKYIYLSIPAAQKFLGMDDEVTGLELKVVDADETEPVMAAVAGALGPGYEVQDWKELNRSLFSALKLEKIAMFIVLCFIILVAAFSIIANGIMLVVEKGREIAILKSMGASDRAILIVFLLLGLVIGGLGTSVGISVGVTACWALARFGLPLDPDVYYITKLPVRMNPWEIGMVAAAALGIALVATLYPAWVASRMRPVEGLREGAR